MKTSFTNSQASSTFSILIAGIVFGSAFLCTKILVGELAILQFVAARLFLGAIAVTAFVLATGRRPKMTREILVGASLLALADALIPYLFVAWGQTRMNSGAAAVLVSTTPLFTALFAQVLAKNEQLSIGKLMGLTAGFLGAAVIASANGSGVVAAPSAGAGAVLIAAMLYAGAAVYARGVLRRTDASTLNAAKLTIGTVMVLPIAFAVDGVPAAHALDARGVVALLWIGMASTGLARVAYFRAVATAGSVRASLVTYIVPVSGVALGCIVLGEPLHARSVGGFALVIAGVALVMYAPALRHAVARAGRSLRHPALTATALAREGR